MGDLKHTEETDAKLRSERGRTNDELLERSSALHEDTDQLIMQARERAKAVLELARARADLDSPDLAGGLSAERGRADAELDAEHAAADTTVAAERGRRLEALLMLLATERSQTDSALAVERDAFAKMLSVRDEVLAGVGHDIRGLLSVQLLNASIISLDAASSSDTIKRAHSIMSAAAQMNTLVTELLDVATLDSGELVIHPERTDLVALVRSAIELTEPAARARSIRITLEALHAVLPVMVDGPRVTRVLLNLLSNAIKFTPEDGRISVSVKSIDQEVEVAVTDTGAGIPPDQIAHIFEKFRQAHTATRLSGYGLGLYIARAIVDAHGGRISAHNNDGGGATLAVRLTS